MPHESEYAGGAAGGPARTGAAKDAPRRQTAASGPGGVRARYRPGNAYRLRQTDTAAGIRVCDRSEMPHRTCLRLRGILRAEHANNAGRALTRSHRPQAGMRQGDANGALRCWWWVHPHVMQMTVRCRHAGGTVLNPTSCGGFAGFFGFGLLSLPAHVRNGGCGASCPNPVTRCQKAAGGGWQPAE